MKAREELLKEIGELKKEVEYWKQQAYTIQERSKKLKAELALLKGTSP